METSDPIGELLNLIQRFHIVDLSHTLREGIPSFPTHSKYFHMPWQQPGDPAKMFQILMHEHNGTHVDAPAHFIRGEINPDQHWMHVISPDQLWGPCHVLDFSNSRPEELVHVERVHNWEAQHHKIQRGDVVLFNFGVHRCWAVGPEGDEYVEWWPGLARDTAEYLAEIGVRAVGTDTLGLDAKGSVEIPAHDILLVQGILIMENLTNLDVLPPRCFFLATPLKIYEGTASPIRALALIPGGK